MIVMLLMLVNYQLMGDEDHHDHDDQYHDQDDGHHDHNNDDYHDDDDDHHHHHHHHHHHADDHHDYQFHKHLSRLAKMYSSRSLPRPQQYRNTVDRFDNFQAPWVGKSLSLDIVLAFDWCARSSVMLIYAFQFSTKYLRSLLQLTIAFVCSRFRIAILCWEDHVALLHMVVTSLPKSDKLSLGFLICSRQRISAHRPFMNVN